MPQAEQFTLAGTIFLLQEERLLAAGADVGQANTSDGVTQRRRSYYEDHLTCGWVLKC